MRHNQIYPPQNKPQGKKKKKCRAHAATLSHKTPQKIAATQRLYDRTTTLGGVCLVLGVVWSRFAVARVDSGERDGWLCVRSRASSHNRGCGVSGGRSRGCGLGSRWAGTPRLCLEPAVPKRAADAETVQGIISYASTRAPTLHLVRFTFRLLFGRNCRHCLANTPWTRLGRSGARQAPTPNPSFFFFFFFC